MRGQYSGDKRASDELEQRKRESVFKENCAKIRNVDQLWIILNQLPIEQREVFLELAKPLLSFQLDESFQ